ncbi:DUF4214 domain-containing protein [Devosia sp. 919]|uniref:DUF4214 domain-containing protein n=1 Tax=Devosia sp. 919 TaxID=2726065 RepID=UPI001552E08F|nr:DUF4214 domain-containing protein [Devosia sp. 919]
MASIQGIYIALFGRPADPEGLDYWTAQTKGGTDLSFLIGRLTAADEYEDLVAGKTPTQVINAIYQQLFDRDADPEGLAHYLALLESGEQSIETIAINILDGTSGSDLLTLDAKIDAADMFTDSLDRAEEVDAYAGNTAEGVGRDFIDSVDASDRATQQEVDAAIQKLLTPGGEAPIDPPAEEPNNPPGNGGGGGGGTPSQPVDPDFEVSNAAQLEDALADAEEGDVITLAAGDYGTGRFVIDESVTLIGEDGVVVRGFDIVGDAETVSINSIDIQTSGTGDANAAIYTYDGQSLASLTLTGVDVTGTGDAGARGVLLVETGAGPSDVDVSISGSSFTNLVSGVYAGVAQGNNIEIDRTVFTNNASAVGGVGDETSVVITRSTFTGNDEDLGVEGLQTADLISIDRSTILRSDGDTVEVLSYQPGNPVGEIVLSEAFNRENVVFVGQGESIQDAIDNAVAGDTIYIGAGTYNETITLNKQLTIVGQDGAIIDGGAGGASTITIGEGANGTVITGLTVFATDGGNAIYTPNADVDNVTISGNTFDAGDNTGGPLAYLNPGADGWVFENNEFRGAFLTASPLLGFDSNTGIDVYNNFFAHDSGPYAAIEVFGGEVEFVGNTGPGANDIDYN